MASDTTRDRTTHAPAEVTALRVGATLTIVGALAFGALRVLHGDTPSADADTSLTFVAGRPTYAAIQVGAVLAAVLGRWGLAASLVKSTSEGLALPELAKAAGISPPVWLRASGS